MSKISEIRSFLNAPGTILDVRSPGEYQQAHIPGAVSFPLFDDRERAEVGTYYKQQGKEAAIILGVELVGNKMAGFVRSAKQLTQPLRIHCWRGGMRSSSMAWLLTTAGMEVCVLAGGYKAFRQWVRETLDRSKPIVVLAGMTGTQKTAILQALAEEDQAVLDLESLANHRGSSYGAWGLPSQPSTEQFENLVAMQWSALDPKHPVWIEAESRRIGLCRVPDAIFDQMMQAPILQITRPRSDRLALLVEIYGTAEIEELVAATDRIRKKLGGLRTQEAIDLLRQAKLAQAFDLVLDYYDKTYQYDLDRRQVAIDTIDMGGLSAEASAKLLIEKSRHFTLHRVNQLSSSDLAFLM